MSQKRPKWHITQNFGQLSRVCQSAQVPQGDLRAKQQCLAGHQYICVVDFALGFYAIEVEEESQPYLCIYTEGIGYHAYARMPMGIADTPPWFCNMTGRALHDLTTTIQLETFVDDNALAGNDFANVLQCLRVFFERCREQDLSVSPQKTCLFIQDIVFGGLCVGKDVIRPNIAKLEAVANWPMPQNLLDLMRFLGLMGYFRSLI